MRNSIVAVSLQVVSLLIGFWSRRIFLNHLGTEILGLNTTANILLQFLNLAELGIGSAIAVTLYKPIFDDDKQSIKEIVALQGWMYKIIALIVMGGSAIMMCFFPMIFSKTPLPLWYAYASFGVLLYSNLLGYFFNYKQILLDAHQLNYKIQLSTKLISIFKLVIQAFTIKYLDNGYIWWLVLEALFATVTAVILSRTVNKTFPYIKESVPAPGELRHKYPSVVTKVKQMFFHKIAGIVIGQATPMIIYAFASLTLVAKYGNYLILTNNLTLLLGGLFMGIGASVGNMVAEHNNELTMKIFRELFSSRFWMTSVCCICLWFLTDPFISLWIGPEYVLDKSTLLLVIVVFYIANTRNVVEIYLNAYGLFRDIWAPMLEAVICLSASIILGKHFGLNGILSGLIISQIIMVLTWKPIFLFHSGLKQSLWIYIKMYTVHLAVAAVTVYLLYRIKEFFVFDAAASFASFFLYALIIFSITAVLLFALLYLCEKGMRSFMKRLFQLFK